MTFEPSHASPSTYYIHVNSERRSHMNAYILAVIVPAFEFGIQRIDCFRVVQPCYHNTYRTTHPPTHPLTQVPNSLPRYPAPHAMQCTRPCRPPRRPLPRCSYSTPHACVKTAMSKKKKEKEKKTAYDDSMVNAGRKMQTTTPLSQTHPSHGVDPEKVRSRPFFFFFF